MYMKFNLMSIMTFQIGCFSKKITHARSLLCMRQRSHSDGEATPPKQHYRSNRACAAHEKKKKGGCDSCNACNLCPALPSCRDEKHLGLKCLQQGMHIALLLPLPACASADSCFSPSLLYSTKIISLCFTTLYETQNHQFANSTSKFKDESGREIRRNKFVGSLKESWAIDESFYTLRNSMI